MTVPRCVFGAEIRSGPFKGESYDCGAPSVGRYFDPLYKCDRPVCRRHANVIIKRREKYPDRHPVRFWEDKP